MLAKVDEVFIEIGAGTKKGIDNWLTIDISSTADIKCDVREGLPFENASVSMIYSEHFLEHLTYKEMQNFFKESLRVLKSGGMFSVCVPNARLWIEAYIKMNADEKIINPKIVNPVSGYLPAFNNTTAIDMINYIAYMDGNHKYMFDQENLIEVLKINGFIDVVKREFDPKLDWELRKNSSIYALGYKERQYK